MGFLYKEYFTADIMVGHTEGKVSRASGGQRKNHRIAGAAATHWQKSANCRRCKAILTFLPAFSWSAESRRRKMSRSNKFVDEMVFFRKPPILLRKSDLGGG
jgi:hypothetical protein